MFFPLPISDVLHKLHDVFVGQVWSVGVPEYGGLRDCPDPQPDQSDRHKRSFVQLAAG
jgi:hypothetical protein